MAQRLEAVRKFWSDETAATVAEYLLMICLIGVAGLTAVALLGNALGPLYLGAVQGLN